MLVKFFTKSVTECHTQTDSEVSEYVLGRESVETHLPQTNMSKSSPQETKAEACDPPTNVGERESGESRRYPRRERRPPQYLRDYQCEVKCDNYHALTSIDYCYRVICDIPCTLKEAMSSPESD